MKASRMHTKSEEKRETMICLDDLMDSQIIDFNAQKYNEIWS